MIEKIEAITVRTNDGQTEQYENQEITLGEDGVHVVRKNGQHIFFPWFGVAKVVLTGSSR